MIFERLHNIMKEPNKKSLDMSLADCHVKGVFSLVVDGEEHGRLTRVFIATKKINPFDIQLHSHRYSLSIGVIHGVFEHHIAKKSNFSGFDVGDSVNMQEYEYKSPLNGGVGLRKTGNGCWDIKSSKIPVGGEMYLPHSLIHTVSCSKGSIWVVQEHGFKEDHSVVLGTSFITEGLYNPPLQFQTNNMFQLVMKKLSKLVDGE